MKIERDEVTREEVIRFYAKYDWRKKPKGPHPDLDAWPWDDPGGLDRMLAESELKKGVLAAYRRWKLVEFGVSDILECAIFNGIFPGEPQALCRLVLRGKVATWHPDRATEWWQPIGSGMNLDVHAALIVRPATKNEAPAKWYIEDGSGRALALLQRILQYGEIGRTAWAYLGYESDERSVFIGSHPELRAGIRGNQRSI